MRKNISFLNIIKAIALVTGLLLSLFSISFVLVSFSSSHEKEEISLVNIPIYQEENVENFSCYEAEDYLYIMITLKKEENDYFLLEYAYYYFHKYFKIIYLEAIYNQNIKYVTINNSSVGSII